MSTLSSTLQNLTTEYLALHTRKEDLFWEAKMGLGRDSQATQRALGEAEIALNRFLQSPERLASLRALEKSAEGDERERRILGGWLSMFAAHVVEDPRGRALSERIVEKEQELAHKRGTMKLGYVESSSNEFVEASSVKLGLILRTDPDEARRKAAYEGLLSIERFVLDNGFIEIVKLRNELGRLLGYEDYYDYRVQVVERMSKAHLFEVLSAFVARTEAGTRTALAAFANERGSSALEPWNFVYLRSGDLSRALDPYFAFADALRRWGTSFAALGVSYRGATLTLDLVDRRGKYENGFMHGPGPAFFDEGQWKPARINFTANAIPGAVGSGLRAAETLFHEGGHAAHFSNILSDAPCFSQEFAPTSVAYAETQSMFMDSLLGDADWRAKYARDKDGNAMPLELVERSIREHQPFRAWEMRAMVTVPFAEKAIYELRDDELTKERVLQTLRTIEQRMQGLSSGLRPVLAIPHLLAGESSAYYHGYVLAEMAVQQTRAFFLARDGRLTDNPRIGPDLARAYWSPGNQASFDETLMALTGKALSADALVDTCNETAEGAVAAARVAYARAEAEGPYAGAVELDATIHVIHGPTEVASTDRGGFVKAAADFANWIDAQS
ncbi:MAG: peptidase M3 [Sandaracinaceae bacterium]|nr:peptidase M3 [Sandaracinaceae bacterium]